MKGKGNIRCKCQTHFLLPLSLTLIQSLQYAASTNGYDHVNTKCAFIPRTTVTRESCGTSAPRFKQKFLLSLSQPALSGSRFISRNDQLQYILYAERDKKPSDQVRHCSTPVTRISDVIPPPSFQISGRSNIDVVGSQLIPQNTYPVAVSVHLYILLRVIGDYRHRVTFFHGHWCCLFSRLELQETIGFVKGVQVSQHYTKTVS